MKFLLVLSAVFISLNSQAADSTAKCLSFEGGSLNQSRSFQITADASEVTAFDGVKGQVSTTPVQGFDSARFTLYTGLTLYTEFYGNQETYEGNGIPDMEAVLALETDFLKGEVSIFEVRVLSTNEDGELDNVIYLCSTNGQFPALLN